MNQIAPVEETTSTAALTPEQFRDLMKDFLDSNGQKIVPAKGALKKAGETKTTWWKMMIPIVASSLLSAGMTGIGTVSSISKELAVEHASVSIALDDYNRRITKLEKVVVPRDEVDSKIKDVDDNLKELQDQNKVMNDNVTEIRKMLFERFTTHK